MLSIRFQGSSFCTILALGTLSACAGTSQHTSLKLQRNGWEKIHWQRCPSELPGHDRAQCALLEVPLDPQNDRSPPISVLLRRRRPQGEPRGQLWALSGGPGEAGDGFVEGWFADTVLEAGFELVVPSHRGTAYGTTLSCQNTPDLRSCVTQLQATWGPSLRHFDTHAAAQDLLRLAQAYLPQKGPALLFGGSYGTIWVQRVLAAAPELFDAALMDSAGDLGGNFEQVDLRAQHAGERALGLCAQSPGCARHFVDGVAATLRRVVELERSGLGCLSKIHRSWEELQGLMYRLLSGTDERVLIAPLVHRIDRCDEDDQRVLDHALSAKRSGASSVTGAFNLLVNLTVIYRELYQSSVPASDLLETGEGLLFGGGAMKVLAKRRSWFPKDFERKRPALNPQYTGPLHIVQGSLDPLSAPETIPELRKRWHRAAIDALELPFAGHASPRFTKRDDQILCSAQWLSAFLQNPAAPLDPKCMQGVAAPDWEAADRDSQRVALELFGSSEVWGSTARASK